MNEQQLDWEGLARRLGEDVRKFTTKLEEAHAQLQQATTEAAAARREVEELRERIPESWEGDGGIGAMQSLAHYFLESGYKQAYHHIRAAAHFQGWCIDNGGADYMTLEGGRCPLCDEYPSPAQPERKLCPSSKAALEPEESTETGVGSTNEGSRL